MSETWFMTGGYREPIQAVEVVKVTEKTLTLRRKAWSLDEDGSKPIRYVESRQSKSSSYENFFPTWEAAYTYLLEKAEHELVSAKRAAHEYEQTLEKLKELTKPEAA